MRFADIAGIKIPGGDAVKIACGGTILWEAPSGDGMPAGYVPCEYLQMDGGQYVDTGIICTNNTKIKIVFTREDSGARYLFGAESGDNKASITGYQSGTNSGNWRFGAAYGRPSTAVNKKLSLTMDSTGIDVDGTRFNYYGTVGTFTTPHSLVLGTSHQSSGNIGTTRHIGKLYAFRIWKGDKLLADYMPCRNPEGVYGFWDNAARTFRPSGTANPFTGG